MFAAGKLCFKVFNHHQSQNVALAVRHVWARLVVLWGTQFLTKFKCLMDDGVTVSCFGDGYHEDATIKA